MTRATLGRGSEELDPEPASVAGDAPGPRPAGAPAPQARCRRRRLSHEFGTPLNAILGNVELILDGSTGPLSGEARACLADIQDAGHDLLRQSRMLLLLVQALEARVPQNERSVPFGPLFDGPLRQVRRPADGALLKLEGAAARGQIVGDSFWLATLARCVVDVYASGAPTGPLRIEITPPGKIRIDWAEFHDAAIPATATALIRRIVELHGGRMIAVVRDAFVLSWPGARLLFSVEGQPRGL